MASSLPSDLQRVRAAYDHALFAPARINLLGDHVDYVGGTVLPMALEQGTWALVRPTTNDFVWAYSHNAGTGVRVGLDVADAGHVYTGWGRFVAGAVRVLQDDGVDCVGTDIELQGNIPASSLSSSAALTCLLLRALLDAAGARREPLAIARLGRRVEIEYIGVNCGLMDQAAVCLCPPDAVLEFDCGREVGQPLPLGDDVAVLVLGTGRARSLDASPYNERQQDARAAVQAGLSLQDLPATGGQRRERRARHVLSELARSRAGAAALRARDWARFGALMNASHASLRDDFEVSCAELDLMVELAQGSAGVWGARMSGGGFGGAAVALVERHAAASLARSIEAAYRQRSTFEPTVFEARSVGPLQVVS